MQIPKRKAEELRKQNKKTDYHVTQKTLDNYKTKLKNLKEVERPEAIETVHRTQEMGDLSENAAYQEAKWRLRRINSQIQNLEDRIKLAIVIESGPDASGRIRIGSSVSLDNGKKILYYDIVGSQETNPAKGRISHSSPLGQTLIGKKVGDTVKPSEESPEFKIVEVK